MRFFTLDNFALLPAAAGSGFNIINGDGDANNLVGTSGADFIRGRGGKDVLKGLGGDDKLDGGNGKDVIKGGAGDDIIFASLGMDKLFGGKGMDTLDASKMDFGVVANVSGHSQSWPPIEDGFLQVGEGPIGTISSIEHFIGSDYDDQFYTSANRARAWGGLGNDKLIAEGNKSVLFGQAGNDRLDVEGLKSKAYGGAGDDLIFGHGTGLKLFGGKGADTIYFNRESGGSTSDPKIIVKGGAGADILVWQGSDVDRDNFEEMIKVYGGGGADTFDFGFKHSGTVQDFVPGTDMVSLASHLSNETPTFAILQSMITDKAWGSQLKLDFDTISNVEINFIGVSKSEFLDGDFIW